MSGFFSSDNKFFVLMSKIFDVMVLSLIWLVLCLPIITIGPASTAVYYTMVKVIRRERSYLLKEFFRSFKLNFKQGAILTLIYAALVAIMYFDFRYVQELSEAGSKYGPMLFGAFLVLAIFVVFTAVYIFPLLSRFTVTIKNLIKWSFFIAIRHIGWTLLLGVLFIGTALLMFFAFFYMPPLIIFLPGVYTLIVSFPMEHIFKRYMPVEEESDEESGVDRWYNE
ncbi:MAG: YesL family protein [Lachnospiraceae bacterium]|nr:YesL family protein [Lachnospiraceae bacterium]